MKLKFPKLYRIVPHSGPLFWNGWTVKGYVAYRETKAYYYVGDPKKEPPSRIHKEDAHIVPDAAWNGMIVSAMERVVRRKEELARAQAHLNQLRGDFRKWKEQQAQGGPSDG